MPSFLKYSKYSSRELDRPDMRRRSNVSFMSHRDRDVANHAEMSS